MTVVQLLTDLKEKTDVYFGLGSIGILFLCAFLFWCVYKEKSRMMKVYVWYLGIACIFMLNPLSLYVIDKTGNMDVYERFFWLLLSPVMVALTASVFMQHSKKLILPCLILLLLCGNSVFTTTEYKKAENMEKISQDAIEVSNIIMRDFEGLPADAKIVPNRQGVQSPRALVTEPLAEDIRMYNANIELWYVRKEFGNYNKKKWNTVASLLTMDVSEIPVKTVIKGMRKKRFSYLVLGSWQELTGDINAYDIRLIGQTENYRVYKYDLPTKYTVTQYQDPEGYQCMSYTIESTDGGLVVVDGGRAWQSEELVNVIKGKGGKVDAWIITHPHDDHCGVLCSILAAEWDKTEIEIDRILLGQLDLDAIRLQGIRVDTVDYLLQGLKGHDNVTYLSAGDELDVIGLHMKVLYTGTPEILSESTNVLNDGSMVFKLSGQKRSMLFLGDIGDNNADNRALYPDTGAGSKIGCEIADTILATYPEDVKSDFVQMAHHGNSLMPDYFYDAVAPRKAFFDAPDWLMENKNKETGLESYYTTPHYKALMEKIGAKIISYSSEGHSVRFY